MTTLSNHTDFDIVYSFTVFQGIRSRKGTIPGKGRKKASRHQQCFASLAGMLISPTVLVMFDDLPTDDSLFWVCVIHPNYRCMKMLSYEYSKRAGYLRHFFKNVSLLASTWSHINSGPRAGLDKFTFPFRNCKHQARYSSKVKTADLWAILSGVSFAKQHHRSKKNYYHMARLWSGGAWSTEKEKWDSKWHLRSRPLWVLFFRKSQ